MKNLFSVNKAADLLERDRATLVRARGGGLETGLQRPQNRTGSSLCDAIKIPRRGFPIRRHLAREVQK
ncbi:hypothetical protein IVB27_36630 [Bradyrhizobium sp. 197]|uniref:hypothetical protein n=1 Tax=Bradyrhizobium sp. 197 TaxID=2782663 RepID=UPI001FFA5821|nr:hypothetical protein [Bradyrhizobium sp. 197]MCK1480116.1 hypothetical protein [Bradyrhizobium sp. 197]